MKDPKRLIHGATDSRVVDLLRAGADEQPSERALRRALRAAALGSTLAATSYAAAASSVQTGVASAGTVGGAAASSGLATNASLASGVQVTLAAQVAGGPGLAASAGGSLAAKIGATVGILKWVGVGALGAASVTYAPEMADWVTTAASPTSKHVVVTPSPKPERPEAATVVHARPAQVAAELPGVPESQAATPPLAPVPRQVSSADKQPRAGRRAAAEPSSAPESMAAGSNFSAEVQAVELGRRAIRAGDPRRGLSLLSAYETQNPRLQLQPEVLLLRLEALQLLGRTGAAQTVARQILQHGATGAHALRARAVLGE